MATSKPPSYKAILLGAKGTGKTSIRVAMLHHFGNFDHDNGDFELTSIQASLPSGKIPVNIFDMRGWSGFTCVYSTWSLTINSDIAFFIFDVTSQSSFDSLYQSLEAPEWKSQPRVIVIANKIDAPNRVVSTEKALEYAQRNDFAYVEVSALHGTGLQDLFNEVFTEALRRRVEERPVREAVVTLDHGPPSRANSSCEC